VVLVKPGLPEREVFQVFNWFPLGVGDRADGAQVVGVMEVEVLPILPKLHHHILRFALKVFIFYGILSVLASCRRTVFQPPPREFPRIVGVLQRVLSVRRTLFRAVLHPLAGERTRCSPGPLALSIAQTLTIGFRLFPLHEGEGMPRQGQGRGAVFGRGGGGTAAGGEVLLPLPVGEGLGWGAVWRNCLNTIELTI